MTQHFPAVGAGDVFLKLEGISKRFGELNVLSAIDLEVRRGEVFALLGPSGSGKSTLLRILAGFEDADDGAILVDGEDVSCLGPARRGFGMVFQSYALFPHLTVARNVAFGLEAAGRRGERVRERVHEMLRLVDLVGLERRRIGEISGGQQQRVALARALALSPRLLMLDEPLSNLDPALRERTRAQLRETVARVGITTVLVTHEQEEAFELGHRVGVLNGGTLEQVATPSELYRSPRTRFVAGFIGRSTFLNAAVEAVEGGGSVRVRLEDDASVVWTASRATGDLLSVGDAVEVMVRPEHLTWRGGAADSGGLVGHVESVRFGGPVCYVGVALRGAGDEQTGIGQTIEVLTTEAPRLGEQGVVLLAHQGSAPRAFARTGSA